MNIEYLKSLCSYIRNDSLDTYGYFNDFCVFRFSQIFNTITVFTPPVPFKPEFLCKDGSCHNWSYKVFTSPQDALNELIQAIAKIKYIQVQSKLDSINKDF